jgi:hypothetical protein
MFFFFRPEWIGSRRWVDGAQHRQKKSVRITGPRPAVTTRATLPIRRCTEYRTSCLLCFPYTTVLRVRTVLKSLTLVHVRCAKIVISVCGVGQSTLLDRAVNAPVETDTHAHRHSTQHTGCTRAIDRSIWFSSCALGIIHGPTGTAAEQGGRWQDTSRKLQPRC